MRWALSIWYCVYFANYSKSVNICRCLGPRNTRMLAAGFVQPRIYMNWKFTYLKRLSIQAYQVSTVQAWRFLIKNLTSNFILTAIIFGPFLAVIIIVSYKTALKLPRDWGRKGGVLTSMPKSKTAPRFTPKFPYRWQNCQAWQYQGRKHSADANCLFL